MKNPKGLRKSLATDQKLFHLDAVYRKNSAHKHQINQTVSEVACLQVVLISKFQFCCEISEFKSLPKAFASKVDADQFFLSSLPLVRTGNFPRKQPRILIPA